MSHPIHLYRRIHRRSKLLVVAWVSAAALVLGLGTFVMSGTAGAATLTSAPYALTNLTPGGLSIAMRENGVTRQITANDGTTFVADDEPALSPDGTKIAFRRRATDPSTSTLTSEVYVVPVAGGMPVQVTHLASEIQRPSWAPDSRRLVITVASNGPTDIDIVDTATAVVTNLVTGFTAFDPAWCGSTIIVSHPDSLGDNLYPIDAVTGVVGSPITSSIFNDFPTCSPDNRFVFYTRNVGPSSDLKAYIYVSPINGGPAVQLTTGGSDTVASVSHDWTLAYGDVVANEIKFQWLGATTVIPASNSSAGDTMPAFAHIDNAVPAPPGFPIAASGTPAPSITPTPSPTPEQIEAFGGGDSYGSGEGAGGYLPETDTNSNHCHRSQSSYQQIVADRLGYKLRFHACSGAIIRDFYGPWIDNHSGAPNDGEIAQLDWLNSKIKLAMVSIGGNDAHFPEVIQGCLFRDQGLFPTCESLYGARVSSWISEIEKSGVLAKLYLDIKAKVAPGAKILINQYPRFFKIKPTAVCNAGGMVFGVSDQRWINGSILRLNQIISKAAHKAGVTPVDTYDALDGHELCSGQPWMNGLILDVDRRYRQQSFHPNALGYFAEARLNLRKLGIK